MVKNKSDKNYGNLNLKANKLVPNPPVISPEDTSIVRLEMICNHSFDNNSSHDEVIATGTGFIIKRGLKKHLVTCWHNITGIHHEKRDIWLSKHKASPTHIRVKNTIISDTGNKFSQQWFPLYAPDGNPIWRVHPDVKNYYDIVVLDIDDKEHPTYNHPIDGKKDSLLGVIRCRQEVFIAGYPSHDATNQFLPIWKSGSIASVPQFPYAGHPKFLIDATTRSGMSGGPVFLQNRDKMVNYSYDKGAFITVLEGDLIWVGMYTAREHLKDELRSSELGFVWRKDEIIEVIDSGVRDRIPEFGIPYPAYKYIE